MDKRQQRCFWADVKERDVWGGGGQTGGSVGMPLCDTGWDWGGGLGFEAQWRKPSKYKGSLLPNRCRDK